MDAWTWIDLADWPEQKATEHYKRGDEAAAERELALADHCRARGGSVDQAEWRAAS